MSDGFQFYDIIFFALIAIFVVLRLRAVLGKRTGQERQRQADIFSRSTHSDEPREKPGRVVHLPERKHPGRNWDEDEHFDQSDEAVGESTDESDDWDSEHPDSESGDARGRERAGATGKSRSTNPIKSGLAQIRVADPDFNDKQFMPGARMAFEMIVEAFAKGDTPVLRPLLGDDVYDEFAAVIRERLATKRVHETTIVALEKSDIVGVEMRASTARISIKFVSQQINLTRDEDGEIVEGDPSKIERVTDIWTFARNTRAHDPNWSLVETRASVE